jgi:hypothetical protein
VNIFKLDLSHMFSTVITDAAAATQVFDKASGYVLIAEQIGKAWGLSGPQKLDAVKAMLLADLQQVSPDVAKFISDNWPRIAGVISAMVAIFQTIGWAFQAAAPIVAAADPQAAPAIAAINAAIQAAKQVQQAAGGQQQAA